MVPFPEMGSSGFGGGEWGLRVLLGLHMLNTPASRNQGRGPGVDVNLVTVSLLEYGIRRNTFSQLRD